MLLLTGLLLVDDWIITFSSFVVTFVSYSQVVLCLVWAIFPHILSVIQCVKNHGCFSCGSFGLCGRQSEVRRTLNPQRLFYNSLSGWFMMLFKDQRASSTRHIFGRFIIHFIHDVGDSAVWKEWRTAPSYFRVNTINPLIPFTADNFN